jgi:hypothetical protein
MVSPTSLFFLVSYLLGHQELVLPHHPRWRLRPRCLEDYGPSRRLPPSMARVGDRWLRRDDCLRLRRLALAVRQLFGGGVWERG